MHADATASEKRCCACKMTHPIEQFAIKNKQTGARQSRCRACQKIASRSHYEANRGTVKEKTAARNKERSDSLREYVTKCLADAQCSCGATHDLAYQVNPGYNGPRVSVAVHGGLAMETLLTAIANSTVMCKTCQGQHQYQYLREYIELRAAGVTPKTKGIPRAEYKKRYTRVLIDRRKGRFERVVMASTALGRATG